MTNLIPRLKNLAFSKTSAAFSVKLLSTALSFLLSILLARFLGVKEYGIYSYVISLVGLLCIPASLGLPTLATRLTASFKALKNHSLTKGFIYASLICNTSASILISIIVFLIARPFSDQLMKDSAQPFYFALLFIPLLTHLAFISALLRGFHAVILSQITEYLSKQTLLVTLVLLLFFLQISEPSIYTVLTAEIVCLAISVFVAYLIVWNKASKETKEATPKYELKKWSVSALPLLLSAGTFYINSRADIIMLGFLQNADAVGIYQVASRGGLAMLMPASVIASVIAPSISKLFTEQKKAQLQNHISQAVVTTFFLTLPLALAIYFWGKPTITLLYGEEYIDAYVPLTILTAGQLFSAAMGASALTLNMCGKEKYTAIGVCISALANIALNYFLIPEFGILGAAIATTASLAIWNLALVISAKSILNCNTTIISMYVLKAFQKAINHLFQK